MPTPGSHDTEQIPPDALQLIERWVIQSVPEAEEQERRLTAEYDDTTVTIYGHFAQSGPNTQWVKYEIAQLRYSPEESPQRAWALFAYALHEAWYPYEHFNQPGLAFHGTLEEALAGIEEDREGMFFGTF